MESVKWYQRLNVKESYTLKIDDLNLVQPRKLEQCYIRVFTTDVSKSHQVQKAFRLALKKLSPTLTSLSQSTAPSPLGVEIPTTFKSPAARRYDIRNPTLTGNNSIPGSGISGAGGRTRQSSYTGLGSMSKLRNPIDDDNPFIVSSDHNVVRPSDLPPKVLGNDKKYVDSDEEPEIELESLDWDLFNERGDGSIIPKKKSLKPKEEEAEDDVEIDIENEESDDDEEEEEIIEEPERYDEDLYENQQEEEDELDEDEDDDQNHQCERCINPDYTSNPWFSSSSTPNESSRASSSNPYSFGSSTPVSSSHMYSSNPPTSSQSTSLKRSYQCGDNHGENNGDQNAGDYVTANPNNMGNEMDGDSGQRKKYRF
ncbi:hypothetical protein BKA69DRAFT_1073187 [Paraphysoderma sedebokerense]|nr:hypothetical protein BKA69DRAFT_1073187 [Paraphysoderma sedebokerense]